MFNPVPSIGNETNRKIKLVIDYLKLILDLAKIIVEDEIPENDSYFKDKIWTRWLIHKIGKSSIINYIAVN